MDDKKVPVITKDEAILKLRMFQSLIASQNWEDKACVVALQMGIRAIQQPEIVHCNDCEFRRNLLIPLKSGETIECGGRYHKPDWYCADGEPKDGDGE